MPDVYLDSSAVDSVITRLEERGNLPYDFAAEIRPIVESTGWPKGWTTSEIADQIEHDVDWGYIRLPSPMFVDNCIGRSYINE